MYQYQEGRAKVGTSLDYLQRYQHHWAAVTGLAESEPVNLSSSRFIVSSTSSILVSLRRSGCQIQQKLTQSDQYPVL